MSYFNRMFSKINRKSYLYNSPIQDHYKRTLPPKGYLDMIISEEYSSKQSGTQPTLQLLKKIARTVDLRLAQNEPAGQDYWSENNVLREKPSDCEDFALHVRKLLIKKGCADHYMHLATTYVRREYHTVLLVNTKTGWYVYDNLNRGRIVAANRYKFTKIEKYYNNWVQAI